MQDSIFFLLGGLLLGFSLAGLIFALMGRRLVEERAILRTQNEMYAAQETVSKQDLAESMNPLKQDLMRFQQRVDAVFLDTAKEQFSLKQEIKRIVEVNQNMTLQTESLTKALKGDLKTQGLWGEIVLERLLESSGLRKGEEYIVQGLNMQLKDNESGRAVRPDVIVKLPDARHIIIDSKVSLTSYERLCQRASEVMQGENEAQKDQTLRSFIASVKAHIQILAQKAYHTIEDLGSPDFVFMFMPVDGAYALAMQHDPQLHQMAWEKGVVLVAPSTLLASLRVISLFWRGERQNNNALEIARRGGMLYDKVAKLLENIEDMGLHLDRVSKSYEAVTRKLSQERGNVIFQIEQLKELGAKTCQSIHQKWKNQEVCDD